ncbi:MAG: UDP-N-acetylmuramate dehydrogenase [Deltaproteobacteria bacterium]|nr:UDP-N-acetylmuramate dehydrogenase [Deltaproteobacteria bacterium]
MTAADLTALRAAFGERLRTGEPLSRHTSFRIGGPADAFIEADSVAEVHEVLTLAARAGTPLFVLGGGTNILVSDNGIRGIVLKLGRAFAAMEWQANGSGTKVRAGAAVPFKKLVVEAAQRRLTGLEFAEGIPGLLGGGLLMNAGAFGGEIANVVEAIEGVDAATGPQQLPKADLSFGYRHFDLPRGWIVTHLSLRLAAGDPGSIRDLMAEYKQRRQLHQPLGYPNAGSIFKNPPGRHAGELIEAAGFKGRRIGGARVSEQHANFIVNLGGATATEVRALMNEIARSVWERWGVRLDPEVRLVGHWEDPA